MTKFDSKPTLKELFVLLFIHIIYFDIISTKFFTSLKIGPGIMNFAIYGTTLFLMILVFIFAKYKFNFHLTNSDVFYILAGYIAITFFDTIAFRLVKMFEPTLPVAHNQASWNIIKTQTPIYHYITTILFGPLVEEISYRFVGHNLLNRKFNRYITMIIVALTFGMSHIWYAIYHLGYYHEFINLISYSGASLVLSFIYIKSNKFIVPVLLHILVNTIASIQ